jgi:hypothetical protein
MPSGPVPLSGYQYQQDAGQSGVGAATAGIGGLAQAIVGNPAAIANARYLGAQTGAAQANTQQTQDDLDGRNMAAQVMSTPGAAATPQGIATLGAAAIKSPTVAAGMAKIMGTVMAANAANGTQGPGGATQSQADAFNASTGNQNFTQTPTGEAQSNQTSLGVAGIGAGATEYAAREGLAGTLGAAGIAANQSNTNSIRDNATTRMDDVVPTQSASGGPTIYTTAAQAGASGAGYATPVTAAQNNSPQNIMTPFGPRVVTTGQAETGGMTPAPTGTDQATANILAQNTGTYMQPDTTGPGVSSGMASTFGTPQATSPGATPQVGQVAGAPVQAPAPASSAPVPLGQGAVPQDQSGGIANAIMARATGQPLQGPVNPQEAAQMDQIIASRLEAGKQMRIGAATAGHGSGVPSQQLMDPIRLQAAWLLQHDPNVRGNVQNAITQAVTNVVGVKGDNYSANAHILPGVLGGQPGPSQLMLNDPTRITWPQGMPVPPQYAPQQAQAGGMPAAFGGGQGAPAPAAAPAQAAPMPQSPGLPAAFGGGQGAPAQAPSPGQPQAPSPAANPQQVAMSQAQDAINTIRSSNAPPAQQEAAIAQIRQRLIQGGFLPAMPPGTPH